MNLLALDTSTPLASVALMVGKEILSKTSPERSLHAQWILPSIQSLLAEAGLNIQQLDGIVFGQGPGSFTGLRIACSVTKGLAYGQDLPVYPISCLAAIAYELRLQRPEFIKAAIVSVIDASMNQLYWSVIRDGVDYGPCKEQVSSGQDMARQLQLFTIDKDPGLVLAGVGYHPYLEQLEGPILKGLSIQGCFEAYPTARAMTKMAAQGLVVPTSAQAAVPVYVRNQVVQP